jgi:hypothetical protein
VCLVQTFGPYIGARNSGLSVGVFRETRVLRFESSRNLPVVTQSFVRSRFQCYRCNDCCTRI